MYSVPDDAWHVELSEAVAAPESWVTISGATTRLPGPALLLAAVPDEDPARQPAMHSAGEYSIPYAIMHWFMAKVAEEVHRSWPGAHDDLLRPVDVGDLE